MYRKEAFMSQSSQQKKGKEKLTSRHLTCPPYGLKLGRWFRNKGHCEVLPLDEGQLWKHLLKDTSRLAEVS